MAVKGFVPCTLTSQSQSMLCFPPDVHDLNDAAAFIPKIVTNGSNCVLSPFVSMLEMSEVVAAVNRHFVAALQSSLVVGLVSLLSELPVSAASDCDRRSLALR